MEFSYSSHIGNFVIGGLISESTNTLSQMASQIMWISQRWRLWDHKSKPSVPFETSLRFDHKTQTHLQNRDHVLV